MGIHDGHRKRVRNRFLTYGLDNFDDHNVLEMLLFYAVPGGDVNPLAHKLINRFGSLSGVFDASVQELMSVEGVGENTAALLKLMPPLGRRYLVSKSEMSGVIKTPREAGEFFVPRFFGEKDEVVYLLSLDAKCKVLSCNLIGRGSVNSAGVSIRKIVEVALGSNASSAVLAHNHTSGIALPSEEDEAATEKVFDALSAVDIELIDHIVVADEDFVSFADNGFFERLRASKE